MSKENLTDWYKIYIERLRSGETHVLEEELDPSFMELDEKDLRIVKPVKIKLESYLANNALILHFDLHVSYELPCQVCNNFFEKQLDVLGEYGAVDLDTIKGSIYDVRPEIREAILVAIPAFAECHDGNCPEREELKQSIKTHASNQPFKDLKLP